MSGAGEIRNSGSGNGHRRTPPGNGSAGAGAGAGGSAGGGDKNSGAQLGGGGSQGPGVQDSAGRSGGRGSNGGGDRAGAAGGGGSAGARDRNSGAAQHVGGGVQGSAGRSGEMTGSRGGSRRGEGAGREKHQKRADRHEHPFLWDNFNDCGKTCLSFGFPPKVRDNRWKEDDRDTGHGRCKFNRDCRVFDGPEHTDPKPERIRDRLNSRGNLVLVPKAEKVPIESIHPNYQHHDKPRDPHFQRAPQPPFKGCGGSRHPFWSSHVEFNVGHGHGVHPYQQFQGEFGRVPRGQTGKVFDYTDKRKAMVRKVFDAIAGRRNALDVSVREVLRTFQVSRVKSVVSRQLTEAEATRIMLSRLTGEESPQQNHKVLYEDFEAMYGRESDRINDDGYFALLLHNEWKAA